MNAKKHVNPGASPHSVFGLGNPLMDYIAYDDYDLLEVLGARAGTMNLIDRAQRARLHERLENYCTIPGGSCANTIRGLAWLGKEAPVPSPCYSGAVGRDEIGGCYIAELDDLGIETRIRRKSRETGVSTIIVTPDCERTMFTFLGACREFSVADLDLPLLSRSQFLHTTGYMWDTEGQREAALAAISHARTTGVDVSFDLADPFVVRRYREDFLDKLPGMVRLLFGNREEISLLLQDETGDEAELIRRAGSVAPLVVMKVGERGCYVNDGGSVLHSPGITVTPLDTTGAGDFFAAGFLFNQIRKRGIEASSELANRFGSAIVKVEGCSLFQLDPQEILRSSSDRH